jgi:hypothetical protein
MGNTEKWIDLLKDKTAYEAWRLIWGSNRDLTTQQRKALVEVWGKINKVKNLKPEDSEWWG